MDNSVDLIRAREQAIQEQLYAWQKLMLSEAGVIALKHGNVDPKEIILPLFERLRKLYLDDLPFAQLKSRSDVIFHAEGPGAGNNAPQLRAVNWLGRTVQTQFSKLATAALPASAAGSAKDARWGITGLVPGSVYMGFALEPFYSPAGFELGNAQVHSLIVDAARSVSVIPQFIGYDGVDAQVLEAITDPALRDAAMIAAMHLSPSDASPFVSVEIYAPGGSSGTLRTRQRQTLRHALVKPIMRRKQDGAFIGELNQIDLDSNRFQLRNVPEIGTLRCVMDFTRAHARRWLGQKVEVVGIYDTDLSGRPRLMRVREIRIIQEQQDIEIDPW